MAAPTWMPNGVGGWPHAGLSGSLHTRLLGFVKTALLRQLVPPNSLVCDLFCGRGLDTERWANAGIGRYIGVDLSASALEEAREQWEQHDRPFPAEFCELDPCMVDLEANLQEKGLPADIVSCLAHLQDSFTSEEMVKGLLKNVDAMLKPGGFFFGTAPDSSTIWYKYQKAVQEAMKAGSLRVNGTLPSVRTEIYKLTFDDDRFVPFGSKYHMRFTDDGLPAQPQLLVHFPSLIRLAREVGLECVEIQNLLEFYDDYSGPFADVLRSCCGSMLDHKGAPILDAKGRLNGHALDVLSLYTTFIFKKGSSAMSNIHLSPSLEPVFKASNSAAKYLTNFPSQHSETFFYSTNEEPGRKERRPVRGEDSGPLMPIITVTSNVQNEQLQQDSYPQNREDLSDSIAQPVMWHDRDEGMSGATQEAGTDQNTEENGGVLENDNEGHLYGSKEEDPNKDCSSPFNKPSFEMGTVDENGSDQNTEENVGVLEKDNEGHVYGSKEEDLKGKCSSPPDRPLVHMGLVDDDAAAEQMVGLAVGDIELRTLPSKEASHLGARSSASMETEELYCQISATRGHRTSKGSSTIGPPTSTEARQANFMEIEYAEKHAPTDRSFKHSVDMIESLNESSRGEKQQEPRLADHSPKQALRGMNESLDETWTGEKQEEPLLVGHSPKHYMRRPLENLDESSRSDFQQELSLGDHNAKHYLRRTQERRDGGSRREKQQEQPLADQNSKYHQWRKHEIQDQTKRRDKQKESPSADHMSRHYERRSHAPENLDDRSRATKQQQEPLHADNSSKHYMRRTHDSSDESNRSNQAYDEQGRVVQISRSKWAVRSSSQQDSHHVIQSSHVDRSTHIVLKKVPTNSSKPSARMAHIEDDLPTPQLN